MKKPIIILFLASVIFTSLQIACSKSEAQTPNTTTTGLTQLNKIVYIKYGSSPSPFAEIWIANYDGTSATKVNVTIPNISSDKLDSVHLSPNGQKIFFEIANNIYSCNVDGTGLTTIVAGNGSSLNMEGAY